MKWFLVVAVIAGCLAHLDASKIVRRTNSGEAPAGNAFFNTGGNSGMTDAGDTVGGRQAGNDANDGGGDTPDGPDSPNGGVWQGNRQGTRQGAAAAAGGYGNEVGDTPDGVDTPDRGEGGRFGQGRPIHRNTGQGTGAVMDDQGEQASDPGQIVGASSSAGTAAGIVVGVVALVGVGAGVGYYVIKKRN